MSTAHDEGLADETAPSVRDETAIKQAMLMHPMKVAATTKRVPTDAIRPSTYNPRAADAERLDLVG